MSNSIDPNVFASLALQYTGGMNAPVDGQQGYTCVADSTGKNVEYVPRVGILGAGCVAIDESDGITVSLSTSYAELTGYLCAPVGTPDGLLVLSTTSPKVTYNGATACRALIYGAATINYVNGTNPTYALALHRNGNTVANALASVQIATTGRGCRPAFCVLIDVQPGDVLDLRLKATSATSCSVYYAALTTVLLTAPL